MLYDKTKELPEFPEENINKIFDENPDYNYLAQDKNGEIWLYGHRPEICDDVWLLNNILYSFKPLGNFKEYVFGWRRSLFERNRLTMFQFFTLKNIDDPIIKRKKEHGSLEEQQSIIDNVHNKVE